ncbi:MAG: SAM-dependent chlorinase/fluorinase [Gammaproteobacteria bacterium]|nr:SAM-dependent chlorinase/fluorinase [Gammaproteobacteria bacterium]
MQPSGIITITTDFGHKGPFAAVMKGVILGRFPDARVVDLAHDIPAQWPPEAGFWVRHAYKYFPKGTVHVAIVDPGVGTEREILLVEYDDHVFIAPDNGLLGRLLDDADDADIYHLDASRLARLGIDNPSATFHGRDIFAPLAAELAADRINVADVGRPTLDWTPGWLDDPEVDHDSVTGAIVTVDAFGNLISNIDQRALASFDNPIALIGGHKIQMLQTYGRAKPGDFLALINSFGVVEIAKAEGSAAEGLGLERGAPLTIRDSED